MSVCAVIALSVFITGMASAAVIQFDGTEYSWLHKNSKGEPEGSWIKQIDDLATTRAGDIMQFQNRWYNSYAGTADIRISYGGGQSYTCIGADEYVFYGLNYGNYYPSGTDSVPFYSKVVANQGDPNSLEEYNLVVSHHYVYNGIIFGSEASWSMRFRSVNQSGPGDAVPDAQNDIPAATSPVTASPSPATPTVREMPTPTPAPGSLAIPGCAIIIACAMACITKKRQE